MAFPKVTFTQTKNTTANELTSKKVDTESSTDVTTTKLKQVESTTKQKDKWEQKTIFGSTKVEHGGYGAFTLKYGTIDNVNATIVGGRGGWILNHKLAFGFGAYGLYSDKKSIVADFEYNYTGGYGGFIVEPIFFSNKIVHFSAPIMFGGGWVGRLQKVDNSYQVMYKDLAFLVVEPGLEIDLNITRKFRIALGAYYSIANDIDGESEISDQIINNLSVGLQFKWGIF